MKLSEYMIPYPILGLDGAYNEDCIIGCNVTFDTTEENFVFHISFSIENEEIKKLIKEGLAAFACEVDSPKSLFREIYTTKDDNFDIKILRTSLIGKVSFFFSVIALENIQNYNNTQFNRRYYENSTFNLQKGSLIAFAGEWTFNADIKYEELRALGSIIEVRETEDKDYTYYEFNQNRIRIFLPSEEFANFYKSNNTQLSDFTHASIVQNALISALYEYKNHKNTLWAETLQERVKQDPKLKDFEDLDELDSLKIQQLVNNLLDNAYKRMFGKMKDLNNVSLI